MALVLTDEQTMLREAAQGFLNDTAPVSQLRRLRDERNADGFDRDTWRAMGEMGWTGVLAPEDQGGVEMGFVAAGVIAEEMGRTLTASPFLSTSVLATTALNRAGAPAQKEEWLPKIVAGEALMALAVDEGRKHAPAKTALSATRAGNGFRLDGTKTFVLDAHVADALIVAARTAGSPGEPEGLTLFLAPRNAPGLSVERTIMVDSRNAGRAVFDGVTLTADAVIGEVDQGMAVLEPVLDAGRAVIAAEMSGAAQESFDRTIAYLRDREQFGVSVGSFQALQHRAAHLYTDIENAKSVVLKALQLLDEGEPRAAHIVAVAKAKVGEVALLCAQEAIQMHGGVGMTDEYDVGFFIKRIKAAGETFGDANFHLDRLARMEGY